MKLNFLLIVSLTYYLKVSLCDPKVLVSVLVRNKAHVLPYFFGYLEDLTFPKEDLYLWFVSDHNVDRSAEIVEKWIAKRGLPYGGINFTLKAEPKYYSSEYWDQVSRWGEDRYANVIMHRERARRLAVQESYDYVWFLDADVLLTNPDVLNKLIEQNVSVVAPMLDARSAYSNFWCGMSDQGYYIRTDEYMPILEREKTGLHEVVMVHSATFARLDVLDKVTFDPAYLGSDYDGPYDDIITFARSAKYANVSLHVLNDEHYGYILAPTNSSELENLELLNLKLEINIDAPLMRISEPLEQFVEYPAPNSFGVDQVYLISLERRPERTDRMKHCFRELGVDYKWIKAVDGKKLNATYVKEIGIKVLPEYKDPYHGRTMTMGEIGCFLSHYQVWQDVLEKGYRSVVVFEDDIRFEPYFRQKFENLLEEMKRLDWDLVYLGRKRLSGSNEPWVEGSEQLVHVDYSYWTLCYVLSNLGAQKLVNGKPLEKLVPVDEYIPIMFNKHPESSWKEKFDNRNLRAYSLYPLLVNPTHYTGEKNYISDTEDSVIVNDTTIIGAGPTQQGPLPPDSEHPPPLIPEPDLAKDEL